MCNNDDAKAYDKLRWWDTSGNNYDRFHFRLNFNLFKAKVNNLHRHAYLCPYISVSFNFYTFEKLYTIFYDLGPSHCSEPCRVKNVLT